MPRSRLTDEQLRRLLVIALWRRKAPTNKQLAFEMGVSERTIEDWMTKLLRKSTDSSSALSEKIEL